MEELYKNQSLFPWESRESFINHLSLFVYSLSNKSMIIEILNYPISNLLTRVKWVECSRLAAQCIYTDTIRCTGRYKPDNHSCTSDSSCEQLVYQCFGRNQVKLYLSGLPWCASKLHAWGRKKRRNKGKSSLKYTTFFFPFLCSRVAPDASQVQLIQRFPSPCTSTDQLVHRRKRSNSQSMYWAATTSMEIWGMSCDPLFIYLYRAKVHSPAQLGG